MSLATLNGIPSQIEQGDTVIFTESFSDYPVGTWLATLYVSMGTAAPISLVAATSGPLFLFTLTATASAAIAPGDYDFAIYVTSAGQRATAKTGTLTVLPDLSAALTSTTAENMVAALETALQLLAASTNNSVNFNNQSYTRANITDYQKQLVYWQSRVIAEQRKLNAQRGAGDPGRIQVQFEPASECGGSWTQSRP